MEIEVKCARNYKIVLEKGVIQKLRDYLDDDHRMFIITDDNLGIGTPKAYEVYFASFQALDKSICGSI